MADRAIRHGGSESTARDFTFACVASLRIGGDPVPWISRISPPHARADVAGAVSAHARRRGLIGIANRAEALALRAAAPPTPDGSWNDGVIESLIRQHTDPGEGAGEVLSEWEDAADENARAAAARASTWDSAARDLSRSWKERADAGFDVFEEVSGIGDAVACWRKAAAVGAESAADLVETIRQVDHVVAEGPFLRPYDSLDQLIALEQGAVAVAVEALETPFHYKAPRIPDSGEASQTRRLGKVRLWLDAWTGTDPLDRRLGNARGRDFRTGLGNLARAVWHETLFRPADDLVALWALTLEGFDLLNEAPPTSWDNPSADLGVLGLAACLVAPDGTFAVWEAELRTGAEGDVRDAEAGPTSDVLGLAEAFGLGRGVEASDVEVLLIGLMPRIRFSPPNRRAGVLTSTEPRLERLAPRSVAGSAGPDRGAEADSRTVPVEVAAALDRAAWLDGLRLARQSDPSVRGLALRAVSQALAEAGAPRRGFWVAVSITAEGGARTRGGEWDRADAFRDLARAIGMETLMRWVLELLGSVSLGDQKKLFRDATAALVSGGRVDLAHGLLRGVVDGLYEPDDSRKAAASAVLGLALARGVLGYDVSAAAAWFAHVHGAYVELVPSEWRGATNPEEVALEIASTSADGALHGEVGGEALRVVLQMLPFLSLKSRGSLGFSLEWHAQKARKTDDLRLLKEIAYGLPDAEANELWVPSEDWYGSVTASAASGQGDVVSTPDKRDSLLTDVVVAQARLGETPDAVLDTLASIQEQWRGEAFFKVLFEWAKARDPDGSAEEVARRVADGGVAVGDVEYANLVNNLVDGAPRAARHLLPLVGPLEQASHLWFRVAVGLTDEGSVADAVDAVDEGDLRHREERGHALWDPLGEPGGYGLAAHDRVLGAVLLTGTPEDAQERFDRHPSRSHALAVLARVAEGLSPAMLEWCVGAVFDPGPASGRVWVHALRDAVRAVAVPLSLRGEAGGLADAVSAMPSGRGREVVLDGLREGLLAAHPAPVDLVARTLDAAASWQGAIDAVWDLHDALEREGRADELGDLVRTCATIDFSKRPAP